MKQQMKTRAVDYQLGKRIRIVVLLTLSLLAGCYNRDTDYFPTTKPATSDIAGTYRLTQKSEALVREGGYSLADASIANYTNGTFKMVNVPDWWITFGHPKGGFVSGDGAWTLSKEQSWWCIRLSFSSLSGENGPGKPITIWGKAPPYFLWLYVGDPDSGRVMIFERLPDKIVN
jgi:hypothetical protein